MKLSRSSMRPINLNEYLKELNTYFDEMDKNKETPRAELMTEARKFHDELLNKLPSTIEVECHNLEDLKYLVDMYGTIGMAKMDDGNVELYIIE